MYAIVMALSRQPLAQTGIKASLPEMGAVQGEGTIFSAVAHPEPTKVFLSSAPKHLLLPSLSAEAEPISKGHCRKCHHNMKFPCQIYPATHGKGLKSQQ